MLYHTSKLKILIGTENIAGWMSLYKMGFEKLGHEVKTAVFSKNKFYEHDYDYDLFDLYLQKLNGKSIKRYKLLSRIIRKVNNYLIKVKYRIFVKRIINDADLLIYMWGCFHPDMSDLMYAKSKNKKVIALFVGSEVRYWPAFEKEFDVTEWDFSPFLNNETIENKIKYIRMCEKFADYIYSVPDQAGLQCRPYFHIQVPVSPVETVLQSKKNNVLKVIHAPSQPIKKGTDIIEKTLNRLKDEGLEFDFISTREMSHLDLLGMLSEADILVDEIVLHGPGGLSFEAMMRGCAVATRFYKGSHGSFNPPVLNIDAKNIYDQLKFLILNDEFRIKLAQDGREYALKNNTPIKIVSDIIRNIDSPEEPHYYPNFFKNHYESNGFIEEEITKSYDKNY